MLKFRKGKKKTNALNLEKEKKKVKYKKKNGQSTYVIILYRNIQWRISHELQSPEDYKKILH